MRYFNWMTMRAKWLVPASVLGCLALLVFDLLAFWAFGLRPVMSSHLAESVVWSLLIGGGVTYGLRWAITGDSRMRFAVAGTLGVMIAISAMHPWHNHWAIDADTPDAKPILADDPEAPKDVVVFAGGPLTESDSATW